jgi:hypothetical protein
MTDNAKSYRPSSGFHVTRCGPSRSQLLTLTSGPPVTGAVKDLDRTLVDEWV